ncbi:MAG: hypothetical protein IH984_07665 [Planctomycetes bacterium]|nr:hypothetical protein [Planctomycetota bacterium]
MKLLSSLRLCIVMCPAVLDAATVIEGINAMKKCVMFTSVALVLAAVLMSCSETSDTLTSEERAMSEGRRDAQETRRPPGPADASMIQDASTRTRSDDGGDD